MRFKLATFAVLFAPWAWSGPILTAFTDACIYESSIGSCSGAPSGSLTYGSDSLTFTDNVAVAGFGIMNAATDLQSYSVTNNTAFSYGYTSFGDYLTISDPAENGQAGTLNMSYYIDGVAGSTGGSSAFLQVVGRVCTPDCSTVLPANNYVGDFIASPLAASTAYNETVVIPNSFSFTYGTQFELYFSMQATAGTFVPLTGGGYLNPLVTGSGSGYADFASTFVLNGLQTGDPNAVYSSLSGTSYSAEGVPGSLRIATRAADIRQAPPMHS